jgi:hypothetical protein
MPSDNVLLYVLANAGARPLDRDPVDRRIVDDVRNGTGRLIASQLAVGDFPVLEENRRPLAIPSDPSATADRVGRTRIEIWLETLARALEPSLPE